MEREKVFVLVGEKRAAANIVLIAHWSKMPSQTVIDTLTTKLNKDYIRFAVMEDILFISGSEEEKSGYYGY